MKKRLFLKLFLAILPLLALTAFYLIADPFMTLWHYGDIYNTGKPHLELNEDYAVTETFVRLYPGEHYDSYIFGSSRSRYFTADQLEKRVPAAKAFQFGVALETLYGVVGKLKLVDKTGGGIKHVLIIADADLLSKAVNSTGHLFRKHPLVSDESNSDFQFTNFMDFCNYEAISAYIKLPKKLPGGKKDGQQEAEKMILKDRDAFYNSRMYAFYKRPASLQYSEAVIKADQKELLVEMKQLFDKYHTDYRLVIPPAYNQKKLAAADMAVLYAVLGEKHIYDFSGINDITADVYSYFETSHFRPAIAYRVMDSVYGK